MSNLLYAIDAELDFKVTKFKDKKKKNEFHPLNIEPLSNVAQSIKAKSSVTSATFKQGEFGSFQKATF